MISTGNYATEMCIQGVRRLQISALVYLYRPLRMKRRSLFRRTTPHRKQFSAKLLRELVKEGPESLLVDAGPFLAVVKASSAAQNTKNREHLQSQVRTNPAMQCNPSLVQETTHDRCTFAPSPRTFQGACVI